YFLEHVKFVSFEKLRPPQGSVTITRTGVGLNPLHGLLICGQLLITTSVSISANKSRYFPGAEIPSTIPSAPSASTGTFMNQLMFDVISRLPSPCCPNS